MPSLKKVFLQEYLSLSDGLNRLIFSNNLKCVRFWRLSAILKKSLGKWKEITNIVRKYSLWKRKSPGERSLNSNNKKEIACTIFLLKWKIHYYLCTLTKPTCFLFGNVPLEIWLQILLWHSFNLHFSPEALYTQNCSNKWQSKEEWE